MADDAYKSSKPLRFNVEVRQRGLNVWGVGSEGFPHQNVGLHQTPAQALRAMADEMDRIAWALSKWPD